MLIRTKFNIGDVVTWSTGNASFSYTGSITGINVAVSCLGENVITYDITLSTTTIVFNAISESILSLKCKRVENKVCYTRGCSSYRNNICTNQYEFHSCKYKMTRIPN